MHYSYSLVFSFLYCRFVHVLFFSLIPIPFFLFLFFSCSKILHAKRASEEALWSPSQGTQQQGPWGGGVPRDGAPQWVPGHPGPHDLRGWDPDPISAEQRALQSGQRRLGAGQSRRRLSL